MSNNSTFTTVFNDDGTASRTVTSPSGDEITYNYDNFGRCVSSSDASVKYRNYDEEGRVINGELHEVITFTIEYDEQGNYIERYSNVNTWHVNNEGIYTSGEGTYKIKHPGYQDRKAYIKEKEIHFTSKYNEDTKTYTRIDTHDNISFTREYDMNNRLLSREQNGYKTEFKYAENGNASTIVITNSKTGEERIIDLDKLVKGFDENDTQTIIEAIKEIPPEALMDLSVEMKINNSIVLAGASANYLPNSDTVSLKGGNITPETIVHELGHAIDARYINGYNTLLSTFEKHLHKIYEHERDQYKKSGHEVSYLYNYIDISGNYKARTNSNAPYATANLQEIFAECYTTMMLGYTSLSERNSINIFQKQWLQ